MCLWSIWTPSCGAAIGILRPINRIKTRSYLFEACLRAMADDLVAAVLDEALRVPARVRSQ
jgi:hypothetical protein